MCGIFVVDAPGLSPEDRVGIAKILADEMEGRGRLAYGVFGVETGTLYRGTGPITSKNGTEAVEVVARSNRVFFGHTRFPTEGANVAENAHPFVGTELAELVGAEEKAKAHGRPIVVGVHNGVVGNHDMLNRQHSRRFRVDSQHLIWEVQTRPPEGPPDWSSIFGYGTVVWNESNSRKVFLARFEGGACAIARVAIKGNDGDKLAGVVMASTASALAAAARKYPSLSFRQVEDLREGDIAAFSDGQVYLTKVKVQVGGRTARDSLTDGYGSIGIGSGISNRGRLNFVDASPAQAQQNWGSIQVTSAQSELPELLRRSYGVTLLRHAIAWLYRHDTTTLIPASKSKETSWGRAQDAVRAGNALPEDIAVFAEKHLPRKIIHLMVDEMQEAPYLTGPGWWDNVKPRWEAWSSAHLGKKSSGQDWMPWSAGFCSAEPCESTTDNATVEIVVGED